MTSRARKTTLAHLQRLAAAAVLTACDHSCGGSGYGVVDPMPRPGGGRFIAQTIVSSATFSGSHIVVDLKDPTFPGATFAAKADGGTTPTVSGGKIISMTPTADGLRIELEPDAGHGALYIVLDIDGLDAGSGRVEVAVSWGSSTDGGRAISSWVNDR